MKGLLSHIRPQVLTAVLVLAGIAVYAISRDALEIAGVCTAGIVAISNRILESQDK
ncbi:MAG: hypothetical protein WD533_06505 [Dehalococcoidia bacterium]